MTTALGSVVGMIELNDCRTAYMLTDEPIDPLDVLSSWQADVAEDDCDYEPVDADSQQLEEDLQRELNSLVAHILGAEL